GIDGSARGQNHGCSSVYFTGSFESRAGMGGYDGCCPRFSRYGSAPNGQREGANSSGRVAGETKNIVANRHDHLFPRPPVDCGTEIRERNIHVVASGMGRGLTGACLEYMSPNDLLRPQLCLPKSEFTCAQ